MTDSIRQKKTPKIRHGWPSVTIFCHVSSVKDRQRAIRDGFQAFLTVTDALEVRLSPISCDEIFRHG